ncbi:hypothetical protein ACIP46_35665 [Streptomyces lavendulae]|uniref:hypothetical protein n=1 Tax=Streptomyces lavendulae TaxID=1914 RepID=UPI00380596AF
MGHQMARYTPINPGAYRMTAAGQDAATRPIPRTASQAKAERTTVPRTDVPHETSQPHLGTQDPAVRPLNDREGER